ncbi:MAG: N-acetylmuramoyl-L-alanine amidase [Parvularculaceae bacterium]|nr:N-acetylmuramoyl-L-alanine amidase [Parvularculaceae bacterium]
MRLILLRIFILLQFGLAAAFGAGGAIAAELDGVRFGVTSASETRIVLDLVGAGDYALSGDLDGQGRIVVDLDEVRIPGRLRNRQAGSGHVGGYVARTVSAGRERITFDLAATAAVKAHFVIPPSASQPKTRIVIDLITADKPALLASLPAQYRDLAPVIQAATQPPAAQAPKPAPSAQSPSQSTPATSSIRVGVAPPAAPPSTPTAATTTTTTPPSPWGERPAAAAPTTASQPPVVAPSLPAPITVVIDAGHGGVDPGAAGPAGTLEKHVTLAAAKELAAQLRAKGRYNVVLTRTADDRLHLDDRSRIAREAGARLFISLHADSFHDPDVRGGSVYTLSEKGSARAANEVKSDSSYEIYGERMSNIPRAVSSMVLDVTQRHTQNESQKFAALLLGRVRGVTPLLNQAHRREDLYVLLSPDVPAVLFELAFISNVDDEKNLNSPTWRKSVMRAVSGAIDAYFDQTSQPGRAAATGPTRAAL